MTPDGVQQALRMALGRRPPVLHVMRERDVGLFSLIQQVIANVPWAAAEGRVPVVDFRDRTCYWTRGGHRGAESVWEYYFEPLVRDFPASSIGSALRRRIEARYPSQDVPGHFVQPGVFVTNHYGEHPSLVGKALRIPYETGNPDEELRKLTSEIIRTLIRPRGYIKDKAARFHETFMDGADIIGVHVRGTDAVSPQETREYRRGSLNLARYEHVLTDLLAARPTA